jgi:quaternary ammonium compound-resistance protein SugE
MAWFYLFLAGLFEIVWAVGLKYTEGFTRPAATAVTIAAMVVSLGLLGLAVRDLPIGTAYAVWTGVGAAGAAILGIILFAEAANAMRIASIALIIAGVIGLKLANHT